MIFKNIKGMIELNNKEPVKIKIIDKETFSIGIPVILMTMNL